MRYKNIVEGVFLERPNRFIAYAEIDGKVEVCHVKNTGRCKELLIKGTKVYLQKSENPNRKTGYDLIAVKKSEMLINMDSQIPNKIFEEWAKNGGVENLCLIKGEQKRGNSRLDFYIETDKKKIFAEIKGVTLEKDKIAMFPDAPTERGVKHLLELCDAVEQGFEAWVVFIIQMEGIKHFVPNKETHPEFADALKKAKEKGVKILALECRVLSDEIYATNPIPVYVD